MSEQITVNMDNLTKDERDQLLNLIETSNKKKTKHKLGEPLVNIPRDKDVCWVIQCVGMFRQLKPKRIVWCGLCSDYTNLYMLQMYPTKQDCEFAIEKLKVERELMQYAKEYNNPEKEDWDRFNNHYYIYYDFELYSIGIAYRRYCFSQNQIYFTSREVLQDAIKEIGEDRIKKYYFGIEEVCKR